MEKEKIFILIEEYLNDGELEISVVLASKDINKAKKGMKEKIEEYKTYNVYDESDFKTVEINETSYYITKDADKYYGKLEIIEKEIQ